MNDYFLVFTIYYLISSAALLFSPSVLIIIKNYKEIKTLDNEIALYRARITELKEDIAYIQPLLGDINNDSTRNRM